MKIGVVFLVAAFVLFVAIATSVTYFVVKSNKNEIIDPDTGKKIEIKDEDLDYFGEPDSDAANTDTRPAGGGGGSGGGGGGGSSGGGSSGSEESSCLRFPIPYALINPQQSQTCNQESINICLNKTIKCAIEVHNEDDSIQGTFVLKAFFSEEDSETPFYTKTTSIFLIPGGKKYVEMMTDVLSSGEDGLANKNLTCVINTASVPEKEFC